MRARVLIVEDDAALAGVLRDNLAYEGFDVNCAFDGAQALEQVSRTKPDLVLLDIALPGANGFEVCRALNASRDRLPIIMLTARTQRRDKVQALHLGADDYVTKPFSFDELLARIHAVLRRTHPTVRIVDLGADVTVDFVRMRATKRGVALSLTAREFAILQHLAERAGKVVTRDELLRVVWGCSEPPVTRTVDNFVARLRRKVELDPRRPCFIRTVHGDGYCLTVAP